MTDTLIRVDNITRDLDQFRVGPVSFEMEPGLVYAVVGSNGSGKTTLFRMLMGLVHPASGAIDRFGGPLSVDDLNQSQRIAYVPEALVGHDSWTVQQLNELSRRVYPQFDLRALQEYQRGIDLYKPFTKLSKGTQRRAMLAIAMASGTDVLLLDEPTDGIDPFARQDVLHQLSQWMESENRTLLMATHNLEDVRRIADVVIVLENGEHIGTWNKDELMEGWQRLWLATEPPRALPHEEYRAHGAGVEIVTSNQAATNLELQDLGIEILNSQQVDMVEALRIVIQKRGGRASPDLTK